MKSREKPTKTSSLSTDMVGAMIKPHPDDLAVDRFAAEMKRKLAEKREEGYGGWRSASARQLSLQLIMHLERGDPIDIANFALFLRFNRSNKHLGPHFTASLKLYLADVLGDWL
jgi:hypothetical protein